MSYVAPVKDMLFNVEHLAHIEQIAKIPGFEAVVGHAEDWGLGVLVDRHDHLRILHAGQVLDRA